MCVHVCEYVDISADYVRKNCIRKNNFIDIVNSLITNHFHSRLYSYATIIFNEIHEQVCESKLSFN